MEEALKLAGRELLLLQASDWPFVIHTKGAVDYGYRRICEHLARFDRACSVAEARAKGEEDTPQRRVAVLVPMKCSFAFQAFTRTRSTAFLNMRSPRGSPWRWCSVSRVQRGCCVQRM